MARYSGSNAELGRACGVTRAGVTKWAAGTVADLGAGTVFTIARLCRVNAVWLATGEGTPEAKGAARPAVPPQVAADFVRLTPANQRALAALVASLVHKTKQ